MPGPFVRFGGFGGFVRFGGGEGREGLPRSGRAPTRQAPVTAGTDRQGPRLSGCYR